MTEQARSARKQSEPIATLRPCRHSGEPVKTSNDRGARHIAWVKQEPGPRLTDPKAAGGAHLNARMPEERFL